VTSKLATYVVQVGNYLSKIAQRYGVTVTDLVDWNKDTYPSLATDANLIQPGWTLQVSPPTASSNGTSDPPLSTGGGVGVSQPIDVSPSLDTTLDQPTSAGTLGGIGQLAVLSPTGGVVAIDTMYDAVNASQIPTTASIVAGYVDGPVSAWTSTDWDRFPNARFLAITVTGADGANVIDCENGDATVQTALDWATRNRNRIIYVNRSTFESNLSAFQAVAAFTHFWIADWTNIPHLYPGSLATQWTSGAGFDQSLIRTDLLL